MNPYSYSRMQAVGVLLAATLVPLGADRTFAQESRAQTIREQQAEKRSVLAPAGPNRAEVLIDRLEDWGLFTGLPAEFEKYLKQIRSLSSKDKPDYTYHADDDNFVTRLLVAKGWGIRIQMCKEAEVLTTLEFGWGFLKQCLRWAPK